MPTPSFLPPSTQMDLEATKQYLVGFVRNINYLLENLDWGNVNRLKVELSGGSSILLDDNGITVNDGSKNTFTVDINGYVTMTGGTVQTTTSAYPRLILNSVDNLFGAYYNANNHIRIVPINGTTPALLFYDGSHLTYVVPDPTYGFFISTTTDIALSTSGGDIDLSTLVGNVLVPSWSKLKNKSSGTDLQTELNAKQNIISGATGTFTTVDGKTVTVSNGIVTSIV